MPFDTWSGHVLLTDPEDDRRGRLVDALVDAGWRVTAVSTPSEGLRALEDTRPDVVVVDGPLDNGWFDAAREIDDDVPLLRLGEPDSDTTLASIREGWFDHTHRPGDDIHPLLLAIERASAQFRRILDVRDAHERQLARYRKLDQSQLGLRAEIDALQGQLTAAQRHAADADRAKSAFLANMSHELRTPLNAILGYAELLEEDSTDPEALHDLRRIRGAGVHLLSLISDVLELARIEAGRADLYFEVIDLRSTIQRVFDEHLHDAVARGNSLELGDLPNEPVVTDASKFHAVLTRVVGNANKFTEHGSITIDAQLEDGELAIRVLDTGIGIAPDQRRRIFAEFTQADASTTRRFGGTGLGLTIALRSIQLLGGRIDVESAEQKGSVFTLTLPVEPADEPPQPVQLDAPAGATVLLIDADATLQGQMSVHLATAGYRVLATDSGVEGLKLARLHRPDVILMDVVLPDVDGWNVMMGLKRDPRLRDIPVVLATLADDRTKGLAVGASDILAKPVRREALLAMVGRVLPRPGGHILVVEDDEDTRAVTTRMLEAEDFLVEAVVNGAEALKWLSSHSPPELILLDLMMPEVDGFHVITELQCRDDWRDIPVVVFTAMDVPPARQAFLEGHVDAVIRKGGVGTAQMLEEVGQLIARSIV